MKRDCFENITENLQKQIDLACDGDTIVLPQGKCVIDKKVYIKNKSNLTIKGNSTTVLSEFDPKTGFWEYSGIFAFENCENTIIEDLTFDTTVPSNSAGSVIATDEENCTFDVEFFPDCAMDGSQTVFGINSIDDEGTPDYLFAPTSKEGLPYKMLTENTARIICDPIFKEKVKNLPLGERMCFRHGIGTFEYLENSGITFKNCDDTIIRNIKVHSVPGFMFVVFPRCHNITFSECRFEVPRGSNRLMSANIDPIHILGLTGELRVSNCYFDGLGDDALNIHSAAGTVAEVDKNSIKLVNKRFMIPMIDNWCQKGDVLSVFDGDFNLKGSLTVENYADSTVFFNSRNCEIDCDDVLGNTAFYAKTEITDCEVRNTRARAFLFQTENITVRGCKIFGIALPAFLISPDIDFWQELGPVKNCLIENCVFEKCGYSKGKKQLGNIVIHINHSCKVKENSPCGIHKNIVIKNNRFINSPTDICYMTSADNVVFENNIVSIGGKEQQLTESDIIAINCDNIAVK